MELIIIVVFAALGRKVVPRGGDGAVVVVVVGAYIACFGCLFTELGSIATARRSRGHMKWLHAFRRLMIVRCAARDGTIRQEHVREGSIENFVQPGIRSDTWLRFVLKASLR